MRGAGVTECTGTIEPIMNVSKETGIFGTIMENIISFATLNKWTTKDSDKKILCRKFLKSSQESKGDSQEPKSVSREKESLGSKENENSSRNIDDDAKRPKSSSLSDHDEDIKRELEV